MQLLDPKELASHRMVLLQYSYDLLHRHENTVNRASKVTDISASALEHCWTGVQYLNNLTSGWGEHVDSSIQQFTITGTLGHFRESLKKIRPRVTSYSQAMDFVG